METYENIIRKRLEIWEDKLLKEDSLFNDMSKGIQNKIQNLIPDKIQNILTEAIKGITTTIMTGSNLLTNTKISKDLSLYEMDGLVEKKFEIYYKTGLVEGVGLGSLGLVGGIADFPVLLGIKIKFLFDCAKLYGYDMDTDKEKLYVLYIFQLAFSSKKYRKDTLELIKNFDNSPIQEIDWEKFQIEYRDYIDLAKLMQFIPIVGGVANGIANHNLLLKLQETAMNCYRLRYLLKR